MSSSCGGSRTSRLNGGQIGGVARLDLFQPRQGRRASEAPRRRTRPHVDDRGHTEGERLLESFSRKDRTEMHVRVDQSWKQRPSRTVDLLSAWRHRDAIAADGNDPAVDDHDRSRGEGPHAIEYADIAHGERRRL
jgi:hypothetical protein